MYYRIENRNFITDDEILNKIQLRCHLNRSKTLSKYFKNPNITNGNAMVIPLRDPRINIGLPEFKDGKFENVHSKKIIKYVKLISKEEITGKFSINIGGQVVYTTELKCNKNLLPNILPIGLLTCHEIVLVFDIADDINLDDIYVDVYNGDLPSTDTVFDINNFIEVDKFMMKDGKPGILRIASGISGVVPKESADDRCACVMEKVSTNEVLVN